LKRRRFMNSLKDKAEALVLLAIGREPLESMRESWIKLIREAQNSGAESYQNCTMIVQIAGANTTTKSLVREIAIGWYGESAAKGDQEAAMLLRNFARMAGDAELLASFSDDYPPPAVSAESKEVTAADIMPPAVQQALGIEPEKKLTRVFVERRPVLVYKPRPQK
jgi:hypothetical protein